MVEQLALKEQKSQPNPLEVLVYPEVDEIEYPQGHVTGLVDRQAAARVWEEGDQPPYPQNQQRDLNYTRAMLRERIGRGDHSAVSDLVSLETSNANQGFGIYPPEAPPASAEATPTARFISYPKTQEIQLERPEKYQPKHRRQSTLGRFVRRLAGVKYNQQ